MRWQYYYQYYKIIIKVNEHYKIVKKITICNIILLLFVEKTWLYNYLKIEKNSN